MTSSNGNISALLALCAGNTPVPVNSPHKGQWRGALMFSLICAWINDWVNNREAGDLRRHRGHYDAIVMAVIKCNRTNKTLIRQIPFVMKTISHYLLRHCWPGYNLPVLIFLFNWFTNTALYDDVTKRKHIPRYWPFPHTKACDVELWCLLWSAPE